MGQMLRPWKTVLTIKLNCEKSVYRQIAEGIIDEIKRGRLKPGVALPGTRQLALDLNVNRKTVVLAYEDLVAEGWLTSEYQKATFVSAKLPEQKISGRNARPVQTASSFTFKPAAVAGDPFTHKNKKLLVFDDGLPDVRLAPMDELARSYKRIFQQSSRWRMMGYGDPTGSERIRTAIAGMLLHDRGLSAEPERICITRGSQMALYLTANALIEKGDYVAIEQPGYAPAWKTFSQCGARLLPVKVDGEGICVEALEKLCTQKQLKAIYVTPHHQFPTAVSMKIDRRMKLVELSNRYGFAIIEDDYDHEFHFNSKSLLPVASLEGAANVIYISSLSKIVAPAVRIGYILSSEAFIKTVATHRRLIDVQGDSVMEHAVAELMEEGAIKKHSRKAYAVYRERRENMAAKLNEYLGNKISFDKPEGGLAYWVTLSKSRDTRELAGKLLTKGVSVIPTEPFSYRQKPLNALRLGYASLTADELERALEIINKTL
jgi:GntR family transcriptional regulator/MocR family aminotransferase